MLKFQIKLPGISLPLQREVSPEEALILLVKDLVAASPATATTSTSTSASEVKIIYKGHTLDPSARLSSIFPPPEVDDNAGNSKAISSSSTATDTTILPTSTSASSSTATTTTTTHPTAQKIHKLLVLATSHEEVELLQGKKERHDQALKNYNKALVSGPRHEVVEMGYARKIEVLGEFEDHQSARELLQRVRDDPAIKNIMKLREWRIGSLIELHPLRDSKILGYNQNKGIIIALRLRTDSLDGFRSFGSIVKVALHELSHMVWSEHDENFHRLDRELNVEYAQYHHGRSTGGGSSSSSGGRTSSTAIMPSTPTRLGGSAPHVEGEGRREVLANAAQLRLTKEEKEMEEKCGGHSH